MRILIIAAISALLMTGCEGPPGLIAYHSQPQTIAWNVYYGQFEFDGLIYHVDISETDKGNGFGRLVHVRLDGNPKTTGVIGKDYDINDKRRDETLLCSDLKFLKVKTDDKYVSTGCTSDIASYARGTIRVLLNAATEQVLEKPSYTEKWLWKEEKEALLLVLDD